MPPTIIAHPPTSTAHCANTGILTTMGRRHPARLQAWRTLGRLRDTAFTAPLHILDEEVTERALCRRCSRGEPAHGRLPDLGMVCLRHRQWLGSPQADLHDYHPALAAERHFRHHLATRNVLHDSLPMLISRECASPAIIEEAKSLIGETKRASKTLGR